MGAKAKAKTKSKSKTKAPAKAKAKAQPKKKPAKKAAKKSAPKKRAPRAEPEAAYEPELEPAAPPLELISADGDDVEEAADEPAKKPGPFARLGSLFARMTGKKTEPPPMDTTVEIVTGDIVMEQPAPPPLPKKRKRGTV